MFSEPTFLTIPYYYYIKLKIIHISCGQNTPRQGIGPWLSDLESDVLTIERPRIGVPQVDCFVKRQR